MHEGFKHIDLNVNEMLAPCTLTLTLKYQGTCPLAAAKFHPVSKLKE